MADRVGAKKIAEVLGITRQYVNKLSNAGVLSYEVNDRGWFTYDVDKATDEYEQFNAIKKGASSLDYDDPIFDEGAKGFAIKLKVEKEKEEIRIKRATADMKELERDEMLGIYHRAEFVEEAIDNLVFSFRAAALALPGKLAPIVTGELDEAVNAATIKNEVRAMLDELANHAYDPEFYRERVAAMRGKDVAESDA